MKTLMISILMFCGFNCFSQNLSGDELARKIANRIKDSLTLTEKEGEQIYQVNLAINYAKTAMRKQYRSPDSIRLKLQTIENDRDSAYYHFLPPGKYAIYKSKKIQLLNNN